MVNYPNKQTLMRSTLHFKITFKTDTCRLIDFSKLLYQLFPLDLDLMTHVTMYNMCIVVYV